MVDIYDNIANSIKKYHGFNDDMLATYLESLKPAVRYLRQAYRSYPVYVDYSDKNIQSAYLLAYFPHYYQLIYKLFIEDYPTIFENKSHINLAFFGAGPGPEVYGSIKYIVNNRPEVKGINAHLFDINASSWKYSHNLLLNQILKEVIPDGFPLNLNSYNFDLTKPIGIDHLFHLKTSDLVVLQNCLNEIAPSDAGMVKSNLIDIFNLLPDTAAMLLVDITGGTSATTKLMQDVERLISNKHKIVLLRSINDNPMSTTLQSVHHQPSSIVQQHLLNGSDGLIPRKWLNYNYSFFRKPGLPESPISENQGISALYNPLNLNFTDANNYLLTKSFIGIDFGTSTTVVSLASIHKGSIVTHAIPITQKDEHGYEAHKPLVQSTIALIPGKILIGDYAHQLKCELQRNIDLWYGFKLELGIQNRKEYPESKLFNNPYFQINNSLDATTQFFKYLKNEIDNYIEIHNYPKDKAIAVSIPASFGENERNDLLHCLNEANIAVGANPFIDEPIAAVLNYIFESTDDAFLNENKTLLVMDCGAGTFDITILQVGKQQGGYYSKCLSISRHGSIGGNLIDSLIANYTLWDQWRAQFPDQIHLSDPHKEKIHYALTEVAEKLKIKLCRSINIFPFNDYVLPELAKSNTEVWLPDQIFKISNKPFTFLKPTISYSDFYKIISLYTSFNCNDKSNTVNSSINSALDKAGLQKNQITDVLMTGGAMRNPYLLSIIASNFKGANLILPDNIQEHVSKGAAIHALALNSFGTNLIVSIISEDISIRADNQTKILFNAGTEIPTSEKRFKIKANPSSRGTLKIPVYSQNQPVNLICFDCIPNEMYEIICWINPEKWLEVEVIFNGLEVESNLVPCLPSYSEDFYFIVLPE